MRDKFHGHVGVSGVNILACWHVLYIALEMMLVQRRVLRIVLIAGDILFFCDCRHAIDDIQPNIALIWSLALSVPSGLACYC